MCRSVCISIRTRQEPATSSGIVTARTISFVNSGPYEAYFGKRRKRR